MFASHGTGGEMTWRCLGNGQYVFQVKFYRDCNGIPGPASIVINTTVPGIPTIPAPLISQTDISPDGFLSDGITSCPDCINAGSGTPIVGLIEEFVYESAPVVLNGVPPASGWEFIWGECCRSASLSNVTGAGSVGFGFRAKMFPFNGQNANSCFDSSPYFAEKPNSIICSGLPIVYQQMAVDSESDSLYYEFDYAIDDLGANIPYATGTSVQNPLPMPVTLNNQTGELSFISSVGGLYAVVIKVTAFKCGIPVSEIRREINVWINNSCPNIIANTVNTAPDVTAPFIDDNTGLQTSYTDTVMAGDTVNFSIIATDFQFFTNGMSQIVSLNAFSLQYGDNFTDVNAGCLIPPCATLNPPPPLSTPIAINTQFNWITTPAHLGFSFSCVQFYNTYYFVTKATDNYCPANGNNTRVFSITVLPTLPTPPVINNNGTLECNLGSNYIYQWFANRFAIPGASSSSYTPTQTGIYQVLAVAPDGQGNYSNGYNFTTVGINENNIFSSISVHPNPSEDGIFMISSDLVNASEVNVFITDIYGRIIFADNKELHKGHNDVPLNLSQKSSGIYNVEIRSEGGMSKMFKIVKL